MLIITVTYILCDIFSKIQLSNSYQRYIYAKQNSDFRDKLKSTNLLQITLAGSLTKCVKVCLENPYCMSVFYNKETKLCRQHSVAFIDSGSATIEIGWRYYTVKDGKCQNFEGYLQNRALDICYKFKPEQTIDITLFKSTCATDGAHLIKIDSSQKQQHVSDFLANLNVDYVAIQGSDSISEGTWVDDNGSPLTYTNWNTASGQPDDIMYLEDQDCLFLRKPYGFSWHDAGCFYGGLCASFVCEINT